MPHYLVECQPPAPGKRESFNEQWNVLFHYLAPHPKTLLQQNLPRAVLESGLLRENGRLRSWMLICGIRCLFEGPFASTLARTRGGKAWSRKQWTVSDSLWHRVTMTDCYGTGSVGGRLKWMLGYVDFIGFASWTGWPMVWEWRVHSFCRKSTRCGGDFCSFFFCF